MLCFHAVQTGRHFVANVAHTGKRGNICVGNNVSSFARAFKDGERVHCTHTTSGFFGGGAGLPDQEK